MGVGVKRIGKLHSCYGGLVDYGYRPLKLVFISIFVWLICTGFYYVGANNGAFAPSDPIVFQNPAYASCRPPLDKNPVWTRCKSLPPEYTEFFPPMYSLNVLLPVGDLGQESSWGPMTPRVVEADGFRMNLGLIMQICVWFETLFGWGASLILVAVISGLTKRDD
ncbi:hypothetical protein [Acidiphilium acidophilum]|uniref:Uncharacterized protein n=1 Tax=Acidiphilium acidophilum TaxID=76588 RepID=A0AAW9DMG3_ACIAO|nr:hypothetical protein [Acidiphilium acidophilum]MDX5930238.1 hypothetical protein [Acidiphilium acidophilum]